ncbi:MAG: MFS transporter [Deltaproteobacteria bacterium]|nr:MFS transporter [Deltaproteobacteria bacterium]MBW2448150.1 MFS transporter [Deltaproteobacteria bacterium]
MTPPTPTPRGRLRNPWWIPPFLGRVPEGVESRHLSLLGAVAFALIFEEYDLAMITTVLKFIKEDFGVAEHDLPGYLGIVRLGAIPAIFLIPYADRIGRRRTFLLSIVASALATFATGFSWSIESFVVFQMIVRATFIAGVSVAYVLVAEEYPAEHRGWGMGVLAALGATGYGLEAGLFSQIEHLPYGWRSLYWIGAVPLLLLPIFRRTIPETKRFEQHQAENQPGTGLREALVDLAHLARSRRFLGLTICMMALGFAGVAAFQFTAYYTMDVLGWSPGRYATVLVVGGAFGIVGNVVAGSLGDRVGRRWVGASCLAGFPVFVALFYWGPGWAVPLTWVGFVFTSSGGRMILRAFSTELFDTEGRGAATGWMMLVEVVASAVGLFVLNYYSTTQGDLARLTPYLSLATLVAGVVLMGFPETRRRELDTI